jgi:MFS family permease
VAICTTTILQEEVTDAYRGRVFSFYDMMFNVTYVLGAVLVAGFMPVTGRSPVIIGLVAAGYAVTAAGFWLLSDHGHPAPGEPVSPSPSAQRSSS